MTPGLDAEIALLRSQIAMYLHGLAADAQGRALLEKVESLLRQLPQLPRIPRQLDAERTAEYSSVVGEGE
jgi:hypothetical protein